jgi:hypothetical protein
MRLEIGLASFVASSVDWSLEYCEYALVVNAKLIQTRDGDVLNPVEI